MSEKKDGNGEGEGEDQFTIQDCLHGREILVSLGFGMSDKRMMILTGSEDTFLKVSEYSDLKGL